MNMELGEIAYRTAEIRMLQWGRLVSQAKIVVPIVLSIIFCTTLTFWLRAPSEWEVLFDEASAHALKEDYRLAVETSRKALAAAEIEYGPEHLNVAKTLDNLGVFHSILGDYSESEQVHLQSLAITEKEMGPEHRDVFFALSNLAAVYRDTGRCEEALQLQQRMSAIKLAHDTLAGAPVGGTCTPR